MSTVHIMWTPVPDIDLVQHNLSIVWIIFTVGNVPYHNWVDDCIYTLNIRERMVTYTYFPAMANAAPSGWPFLAPGKLLYKYFVFWHNYVRLQWCLNCFEEKAPILLWISLIFDANSREDILNNFLKTRP